MVNVAGKAGVDHAAGAAPYAASEAAAIAMIDSRAADLKGSEIGAHSILPSIIDTEANRKADAQGRLCGVAQARGHRARHPVSGKRRRSD
jgi:NAD(P)-dependent dehydrogenase (short-subunit alcohol dehydrogenase family)